MWQRFTERARKVIFYAQEEAVRLGQSQVATEHFLLGLARERDSVASRILDRLGISRRRIRQEVNRQAVRQEGTPGKDFQLTSEAKWVIDRAYKESRLLKNNYIGTEHLLLGLIRDEHGLAGKVLKELGAKIERARAEVASLQECGLRPDEPRPGAEGFPDDIAKLFVPEELYKAVLELRNVKQELADLLPSKQFERVYELQKRRNELRDKVDQMVIEAELRRDANDTGK